MIASLTIPSLHKVTEKKELETGFKKGYSSISQAISRMEVDYLSVKPSHFQRVSFYPAFKKYFNIVTDCGLSGCQAKDGNAEIKDYSNYSLSGRLTTSYFDDGQFITADGMLFMIENPNYEGHYPIFITVDVNGKRPPNAWGHDLFTFQLTDSGELLPMGAEGTNFTDLSTYCSKTSSDPLNGIACAQQAIVNKEYWKNLP